MRLGDECLPLLERLYSINILKYLKIVNNYEISDWEWFFLKTWAEDINKPYILSGPFLHSLNIGNVPIFYNFFGPYSILHIIIIYIFDIINRRSNVNYHVYRIYLYIYILYN